MIVDIHTHTFPDKIADRAVDSLSNKAHIVPHSSGTINGLITSMEIAGIDISVVMPVATSAEQVVKINDSSIRNNEKYYDNSTAPHKVLSFGCMHPEFEDYKNELKRLSQNGIKGIKIHPVYQGTDIDDTKFLNIIDCAAQNNLIVLTHAGLDVGFPGIVHCSPKMCRNVIDIIGDFKFILAHMGGWENWDEVPDMFTGTCAYLDTSFSSESLDPLSDGYWDDKDITMLNTYHYKDIIQAFGSDRILFGSDSPWTDQRRSVKFIKALDLTATDIDNILGQNALKLLDITK